MRSRRFSTTASTVAKVNAEPNNGRSHGTICAYNSGNAWRLRPKISGMPMTKVFRASGFELKMIWRLDTIMKLARNTMIAPITGAGMMERTALSFGENPSRMKSPPAPNPIQRLVAPVALLNATLLAEESDATPPKTPEAVTAIASAIKPRPMRRISGCDHPATLIFSQRIELPKDLSEPQIETIFL